MQWVDGFWADDANQVRVPGLRAVERGRGPAPARAAPGRAHPARIAAVENLGDERYVASAFLNPDVVDGEPVAFEPGLPRHAVATLLARLGPLIQGQAPA